MRHVFDQFVVTVHILTTHDNCAGFLQNRFRITPQGWMRQWDAEGRVSPSEWKNADFALVKASAVVISREDVGGDEELIEQLAPGIFARLSTLLAVKPDPEGLDAAGRQPGILRSQDGSDRVLVEVHRFGKLGILDGHHTGDGVVVSGQVFGCAVDGDIGTKVERTEQIGGQKGVVGNQQQIVAFADGGNCPEIGKFKKRIGEGLDKNGPG